MKKIIIFALLLISSFSTLFADDYAALKLGFHFPDATDSGFIIGGEFGKQIDESLDVGVSFDWFQKEFSEYKKVMEENNAGVSSEVKKKLSETTLYTFPFMAIFSGRFEIMNRLDINMIGALGMEMLMADYDISSEYAQINPDLEDTTEWAFAFAWRVGVGASYRLGSRSDICAEIDYHSSKPSVDLDDDLEREYNMSGIMGRIGIRFYL
ncbi:MAG: hypothetical protein CR982_04405 [Candidatus Cloacimonadota bacterium]|nr:MAG: hypothetical protein CR982_04405 [Candidatus Cloacimonadota bacterium]PIE79474.1 MAG: hypothetical protein CSA15_02955 [Candidatus Delongbacteria bacterium]